MKSIVIICFLLLSCSSNKNLENAEKQDGKALSIKLSRSGCYGTCPIYSVQILKDGSIFYEGKAYTDFIGKFEGELSDEDATNLFKQLESYNWKEYPEKYPIDNVDFPQWQLEYESNDFTKTIKGNTRADEELIELTQKIDELVEKEL